MNHLITGGAGFIGCNLAHSLLARGEHVTIFDNLSRPRTPLNLAWLREQYGARLRFIQADLRDFEALRAAVAGHAVVYHLAGQVAVTTSVANPRDDFMINALGTFNVLEAARLADQPPIVFYASTNKVYGGMEHVPVIELPTRYAYRDMPEGVSEDQLLDFHSPYGCCYSADTTILTRSGWKRFYELESTDDVLTYSIERNLAEFQRPTRHFAYHYQGKMFVQHNRRLQTCVTPNHKMLVSWDCNHDGLERPRLLEATQVAGKTMAYLLAADLQEEGYDQHEFVLPAVKAGKHKHSFTQRVIPMRDWLRFLGWYLAEGHCYESLSTGNCTVTLTTYYRFDEAIEVMRAVGLSPVVDKHHITATSRQMYEYLRPLGKSHTKFIPTAFKQLGREYLMILLYALLDGDGNRQGKNGWRYTTVSRQLADDVQEIALRCGMAATVTRDPQDFYRVYISTTRTAQCNQGHNRSEWIDYDDMVYCVEVPNSVVMVRQGGHAYFSGNSKGSGDQYVRDYARIYGLKTAVFRQGCVYGPRQFGVEDQGWAAHFVIAAVLGRPLTIYGNGKQVRDMLHVDDLIAAYMAALERIDQTSGQIYNLGGGPSNALSVWAEFGPLLERLTGRSIEVRYGPWRPGDQPVYISAIEKARRELAWQPQISVTQGMARLVAWVQANRGLFE
jgi:nucleoside-diphosphate-sugar epimerase